MLHSVNKALDVLPVKADEIEDEISRVESGVMNVIQNATSNGYMMALFTSKEHSPILKSGEAVQLFIDGSFSTTGDSAAVAAAIARMNG